MDFHCSKPPEYFGSARRLAMRQAAVKLRDTVLQVPARLCSSAASSLLGTPDLVFAAMTREGIVQCLGAPVDNAPKYYHGPYILWLRGNRDFLDQSVRYAKHFWAARNAGGNQKDSSVSEKWHRFNPPKFPISAQDVTTLDPVIGISVAEEILGFHSHEIRILYHRGLLQPIGGSGERFKHKRFFLADILKHHGDAAWLHRAQAAIGKFWWDKNHPS